MMLASDKPNFRQVGTKVPGSVLRGASKHWPASSGSSGERVTSIPSKFETVLHRDDTERNAFGNRTQRFGDHDNELPGPGQYHKVPTLVRTTVDSGSVSRLGYSTGFVSKTKRFNDRVRDAVPGPGAYQPPRAERKPQNRKYGMSSFVNTPKPSVNQASSPVPGPGEYNVNQSSAALARNIARTAFDSKSTRGFEPRADVPAPGQYDNPIQLGTSQARANSSPQPVFKSGVRRLADTTGPAAFTPGPGAYNAADAERALRYDWIARAHSSAAFQASAADRFGHIPGKLATDGELGPGSYELRGMADNSATPASSSVFKSKTARAADHVATVVAGAPGPAYYAPASPDRRSHLLNANKKWL